MPAHRKVFFSFHYSRDAWRAGRVRNSGLIPSSDSTGRFHDKVEWETLQRQGDRAIRNWIDGQMVGTSVTVVLIGQETASRPWVQYEIEASHRRGNGLLGIQIHSIPRWVGNQQTLDFPGPDPFARVMDPFRPGHTLAGLYPTYVWDSQSHLNLPGWIEAAARRAGK